MSNKIVQFLRSHLGERVSKSPSPAAVWLNGLLKDAERGHLVMDFDIRPEMTNPFGTAHGGMIALIIDEVIGAAVYSLDNESPYVTVNLNIDYLEAVRGGETITADARVIREGKTLINAICEVRNLQGKLVAKGTCNLVSTRRKE